MTDTLNGTVDVSQVGEVDKYKTGASRIKRDIVEKTCEGDGKRGWRFVAVARDPRNVAHTRISCGVESELARVRAMAEKTGAVGSRVLCDQWYCTEPDGIEPENLLE